MSGILLLLGSNLGDRKKNLILAKTLLSENEIKIIQNSSTYESEPWGNSDQPWFLNEVIQVETSKSPEVLLEQCLSVEKQMGRVRNEHWGERLIDIDILFYQYEVISQTNLTVPHPGILDRRFTLMPLSEKWPKLKHPHLNQTMDQLLLNCKDPLKVKKL